MTNAPNFDWITPQLAVGGRLHASHIPQLATAHGVRAVIDLRDEDKDDEVLLLRHGVVLLHLPTPDLCGVDATQLDRGVAFAVDRLQRRERLLIHCEHGIGRSATLALCVMVHMGHAPLDALEHMKTRRTLISPSPSQFECWLAWLTRHRNRHRIAHWDLPDAHAFGMIAYRHLGAS